MIWDDGLLARREAKKVGQALEARSWRRRSTARSLRRGSSTCPERSPARRPTPCEQRPAGSSAGHRARMQWRRSRIASTCCVIAARGLSWPSPGTSPSKMSSWRTGSSASSSAGRTSSCSTCRRAITRSSDPRPARGDGAPGPEVDQILRAHPIQESSRAESQPETNAMLSALVVISEIELSRLHVQRKRPEHRNGSPAVVDPEGPVRVP